MTSNKNDKFIAEKGDMTYTPPPDEEVEEEFHDILAEAILEVIDEGTSA